MTYGHVVANRRYTELGVCVACGLVPATRRHHQDGDSFNNDRSNLAFLCNPCHVKIHHPEPVTHCRNGHEYTPENSTINSQGKRICRECHRIKSRASRLRRLA